MLDETLRKYQTTGEPKTKKLDKDPQPGLTSPPMGIAVQFDDVKKKELSHSEVPGLRM